MNLAMSSHEIVDRSRLSPLNLNCRKRLQSPAMINRPLTEASLVAQILFVFQPEAVSRRRLVFTPVARFWILHGHSSSGRPAL
jgi:hypothetical protein